MTGGEVALPVVDERRLDLTAHGRHVAAARMEATSRGWTDRARDIPLEHDPLPLVGEVRVRDRHRREERLRVGHDRPLIEIVRRRELDELPEVHDCDAVADMTNDP